MNQKRMKSPEKLVAFTTAPTDNKRMILHLQISLLICVLVGTFNNKINDNKISHKNTLLGKSLGKLQ